MGKLCFVHVAALCRGEMRGAATRLMNLGLESMIFISFLFFNERAAAAGVFPSTSNARFLV